MKKIKIEENMYVYHLDADYDGSLGTNIYVIIDKNEALLIDAGYEKHMSKVLSDLATEEIKVTHVLPSHFHPDHIGGIKLLQNPIVYGNEYANETIKLYNAEEEVKIFTPTNIINDNDIIKFGDFKLQFTLAQGHSNCSMLIMINDRYLHVGDLFMTSNDGKQVLPFVRWPGVSEHIKSLTKIQNSLAKSILLSHGITEIDYDKAIYGLKDRIMYLKALLDSDNTATVEEAIKDCKNDFTFLKWRNDVV